MNEKDIQIVMDTKIVQQILKTIPENMHNQINIIMVNLVSANGDSKQEVAVATIVEKKRGIWGNLFAKKPPKSIEYLPNEVKEIEIKKEQTGGIDKREKYHISKEALIKSLENNRWNMKDTSRELGIPYGAILRRCSHWGLVKKLE